MNWEIIVGLITLVGFIITICKIVSNNTTAMTEMRVTLLEIQDELKEQKNVTKDLEHSVSDHEIRLTVIEKEK